MTIRASLQSRTWSKDVYIISTDSTILPLDKVNEVLNHPDVHWAKPLPKDELSEMIDNSLCFALYEKHGEKESSLEFLGMGRCITDYVSTIYLTDVWVRVRHNHLSPLACSTCSLLITSRTSKAKDWEPG